MKLLKVDRNGTKHFEGLIPCDRCGGCGTYYVAVHNGHGVPAQPDGGVCYKCSGAGKVLAIVKEYTPEHAAVLEQRRAAAAVKKAAATEALRLAEMEGNRLRWLENNGFTPEGLTYAYIGDTFSVKEQLKAGGARYADGLGWHSALCIEGFPNIEIRISDIASLSGWGKYELIGSDALKALIKERSPRGPESNYVGTMGDKIKLVVTIERSFGFYSKFGYTHIHRFTDEAGNILVWKTSTSLERTTGVTVVTGTIKSHTEYNGEKQTELTRCKFEEASQ